MLAAFFALPTMTYAQAVSGDIIGTITDKSGGAIPNATVMAENVATGVKRTTTTNEHGDYRFSNLLVGTYNIHASAPNFADTTISNFLVDLNQTKTASITLQVGQQVTTIEVTGAPPPINTTSAQIENTFDKKAVADLPVSGIGLGVINLSLLQAGVASSGGVGAGTGPSVGGQRPRNNNFTIEGVDNNSKGVTGPLVQIPNDAVEEFSMLQNQYSPEFGHSTGGQFNTVIVSGTNQYHGKAYEYFTNRNLNAIDEQTIQGGNTKNTRYDFNRFGGQVGGPILKNKLFFFGNFEYDPLGQVGSVAGGTCTPTAAGFTTLAGINGLNAANLGILTKYATPATTQINQCGNTDAVDPRTACVMPAPVPPTPNTNKLMFISNGLAVTPANGCGFTGVELGVLQIPAANFTNTRYLVTSMDYDFSSKDQIRGRYIYNSIVGIDASANLPAFFLPAPNKFHLVTLSEYHTFSSNVQNELRVGFNRFFNITDAGNFKFPTTDSFPDLIFFDLNLQLGPDPNGPQFTIQNLYQAIDNLSWTKGNHSFKFGMEARKFISPQSFTQRARGDYNYNHTDLYLHDVNPDNLAERSLGNPIYYGDQIGIFWYVNDNWKIRKNITVNLGLRHEYTTIPFGERSQSLNAAASVPGLIDFSEPRAPKKNFAPRVGFTWAPGSNTSVRAGFGLGYDVLYDNIGILSLPPQLSGTIDSAQSDCGFTPPAVAPPQCPGAASSGVINNYLTNGGILPVAGGLQTFPTLAAQRAATSNHIVVNQKDPTAVQWTLGVQHSFGSKYTVEARYLGTHGYHLNVQERINVQPRVDSTHFLPTFFTAPTQATLDALQPVNTLASIRARPRIGAAFAANNFTTNIVQFSPFGNSIYHGLAVQGTRRFSEGLSFTASYTWSRTIDDSTADFFTTVLTPRRAQDFQNLHADRSVSALSRTHRLTVAAYYDLPYFKTGNWMKRNLLGNWLFAPIYTWQSPEIADVQSGSDANLNGDSAGDRAVLNPAGIDRTGTGVIAQCATGAPVLPCSTVAADRPFVVAYLANSATARYVTAGSGALANSGRNTLPTRRTNNFDLTVSKRFSITEGIRFEFAGVFQNVLNHPQSLPGFLNRVDSIGFTGSAQRNALVPSNTSFNQWQSTFSSNSRLVSLAVKLVF